MSKFANPEHAYVWLDGDAFRAAAGTELPADVYADELKNWLPYGGIEAGFEETTEQNVTKLNVFNYRQSAYKVGREPLVSGMKFRAVDNTEATLRTRAQGGTVTKDKAGNVILEKGIGEEFALLVRLDDGEDKMAWYSPRVTLSGPANRATIDGKTIDGWDFEITALIPFKEILPAAPEGMKLEGETAGARNTGTDTPQQ